MEFKSSWEQALSLMETLDDSKSIGDDEPPYQEYELSFFEKLKVKESNSHANAEKQDQSTEATSRSDEEMDEEFSLILSDEEMDEKFSLVLSDNSDDCSDISLLVHASDGDDNDVGDYSEDHSDVSLEVNVSDADINESGDFALIESDGIEEEEGSNSPVFSSRRGRRRRRVKTSKFSINPASLPIAKVVLERLPQSLLQCKSITVSEDEEKNIYISVLSGSPDYVIQLCLTCQKMYLARKKIFFPEKCFTCCTPLMYMCTKCHDNYYTEYDDMVHHWQYCKNEEVGRERMESTESIGCLEEDEANEENDHQLCVETTKLTEIVVPRLPTAIIVLERLPESVLKPKVRIENEDLNNLTEIKPKDSSFKHDSVQRYCSKCKKKTTNHTNVRRPRTCKKCTRLLQYVCTSCNEEYFFNYLNLRQHRKYCKARHQWEKFSIVLYRCLVCDFKTQREFSMVSHLDTTRHSRDSEGLIQTAEAYDKSAFIREQHKIVISKRTKLYCPKCQTFIPSTRYEKSCRICNSHLHFHCIKCGDKKPNRRAMCKHLRAKCNLSRYQCVFCDYASGGWYQMQSHLNKRHVSGQFHCDKCSFRAKRKKYLKSHMIECHSEVEVVEKFYKIDFDPSRPWRMNDYF